MARAMLRLGDEALPVVLTDEPAVVLAVAIPGGGHYMQHPRPGPRVVRLSGGRLPFLNAGVYRLSIGRVEYEFRPMRYWGTYYEGSVTRCDRQATD